MIYTTLSRIKSHGPCADGWRKLLKHLGKTGADDEPLALSVILESNDLDDALWCLRSVPEESKRWRLLAVAYARKVQHLMTDPRSLAALDVAERHANGNATDEELAAARDAAQDAARAAARDGAAQDAARAAAWAAARAAARDDAAWAAAWDAARAAAWDAARDAARDAAWEEQSQMFLAAISDEVQSMSVTDFFDEDQFDPVPPPQRVGLMPDVCIDLETMGNRPNAPIIALGAVAFNLAEMTVGEKFYANINLASSVALGSVMDPSTVMWWMQQSEDARKAVTRKGRQATEVLADFADWLTANVVALKDRRIWACGTDSDCVILAEHYRKAGLEVPWMYYASRDYRTIRELWKSVPEDTRVGAHNALDDAVHQVNHLLKIKGVLRGNKS